MKKLVAWLVALNLASLCLAILVLSSTSADAAKKRGRYVTDPLRVGTIQLPSGVTTFVVELSDGTDIFTCTSTGCTSTGGTVNATTIITDRIREKTAAGAGILTFAADDTTQWASVAASGIQLTPAAAELTTPKLRVGSGNQVAKLNNFDILSSGQVSQAYSSIGAHTCVDVFTVGHTAGTVNVGDTCLAGWVGGTVNVGCSPKCRVTAADVTTGTLCNQTTAALDCDGATTSIMQHVVVSLP